MISAFDGLGYPSDHFSFCIENGLDAHAITEHGNFNSYAHAQLWVESWRKANAQGGFKYIPGIESYFHPDLNEWKRDKELADAAAADKRAAKKLRDKNAAIVTPLVAIVDADDEAVSIETTNNLTIENEEETKTTKFFNPVNRRHHLVLLPKDEVGLQQLFHLTSRSFLEGFFRFPRIDLRMLRETCTGGHIVASSACIGGLPSFCVYRKLQEKKFDELVPSLLDEPATLEAVVAAVGDSYQMMVDAFGVENFYLELQFNRLPAQDVSNRAILEFARRNGINDRLIVTCDAHYYNPDVWKERELYKKLGFMNYTSYSPDSLPKSKDDLKCELYPKNAGQLWDEYLSSKARNPSLYVDDDVISAAVERTHDIAHKQLGEIKPDRSVKLPKSLVPSDKTPIQHLTRLCLEGMKARGVADRPAYVERLREELLVIKQTDFAEYFVTLHKIIELARNVGLVGPGRGSGAGSLVNYVLKITDLDPIEWDLPFARFMSVYRVGMPDVDTDVADRDKVLDQMRAQFGYKNVVPISNYNTTKLKSLVKDISKFYGIPFDEVNSATATVEQEVKRATTKHGDDKNLFVLEFEPALEHSPSFKAFIDAHPEVGESIKILFRQNRSLGRHAGGVLVCDDLETKMPLITSKGEPQSPWVEGVQHKHLEKIGNFVKYDILGLETLRLIERTIALIIKRGFVEIDFGNGSKVKAHRRSRILLTDGTYRAVGELTCNDDVAVPVTIDDGSGASTDDLSCLR